MILEVTNEMCLSRATICLHRIEYISIAYVDFIKKSSFIQAFG